MPMIDTTSIGPRPIRPSLRPMSADAPPGCPLRALARTSYPANCSLKSRGPVNRRPGRNEVSK